MTATLVVLAHLVEPGRPGDPWTVAIVCPFCRGWHEHGAGLDGTEGTGHRLAHCGNGRSYSIALFRPRTSTQGAA